jgi:transposase
MQTMLMVGVDMAKKEFVAALYQGQSPARLGTFPNEVAGYKALTAQVSAACHEWGVTQVQLVIEATGGYEAALVAHAYEQSWLVSMPNPKQVRDWAKGVGYRGKSDRMDAQILAHYGAERQPTPRPQLAEQVSELDSLLKRRADLEQARQKEQTRLSELAGRPGISPQVAESLRQVIEALTEALAGVQQAIEKLCQSHPPFQQQLTRLLALPGVGPKVVLPLMVKLFQWQTLTHGAGSANGTQRVPAAFVGLDPQPYTSGTSVRKHPGISKMGDNELRRLLYMGALGGVRGHNPLMPFYQRLVGPRGRPRQSKKSCARCCCQKNPGLGLDYFLPRN